MDLETREIVNAKVCEVFERLAFMFGDAASKDELDDPSGPCFRAEIHFTGDRHGSLVLIGPSNLCPLLAANVLGADPDDPRAVERADDAIKELLNVACGHLLSTIAGEDPVFDLMPPSLMAATSEEFTRLMREPDSLAFIMDDLPLLVRFRWEESRP